MKEISSKSIDKHSFLIYNTNSNKKLIIKVYKLHKKYVATCIERTFK
jgi:hypothetical protein